MKYKLKKIGINLLMIAGLSFGCYSIFTTLLPTLFGHGSSSAFDMGIFFSVAGLVMAFCVLFLVGELLDNIKAVVLHVKGKKWNI